MHTNDKCILQSASNTVTFSDCYVVNDQYAIFLLFTSCYEIKHNYNICFCICVYFCICFTILSYRNSISFWILFCITLSIGFLSY